MRFSHPEDIVIEHLTTRVTNDPSSVLGYTHRALQRISRVLSSIKIDIDIDQKFCHHQPVTKLTLFPFRGVVYNEYPVVSD